MDKNSTVSFSANRAPPPRPQRPSKPTGTPQEMLIQEIQKSEEVYFVNLSLLRASFVRPLETAVGGLGMRKRLHAQIFEVEAAALLYVDDILNSYRRDTRFLFL